MARAHMPADWTLQKAMEKPLTGDERKLLESWNRHDMIQANDEAFGLRDPDEPRIIDGGNTGDTDPFTRDTGFDATAAITQEGHSAVTPGQAERARQLNAGETDLDIDIEALRQAEDDLASDQAPDDDDGGTEDDTDDFGKMTNKQLREELRKRDLPVSGNRQELLGRVRTADAEGDSPDA